MAHVVHADFPRQLSGSLHIIRVQEHVGIITAELQNRLLQVLAGSCADGCASTLRTSERNTLHTWVLNHRGDLVVGGVHVLVHASRHTRIIEDFLDCGRGFGADLSMLQNDGVAVHQVWRSKTSDLVVREVPRHDAYQRTQWEMADDGGAAVVAFDLAVSSELFTVVGVVAEDIGRQLYLVNGVGAGLAHFAADDVNQVVLAFVEKLSDTQHVFLPLGDIEGGPLLEAFLRGGENLLDLIIGGARVRRGDFTGRRVFYSVGQIFLSHDVSFVWGTQCGSRIGVSMGHIVWSAFARGCQCRDVATGKQMLRLSKQYSYHPPRL